MDLGIIIGVVVVVLLLIIFLYNNLISKKNKVEKSLSTIDTYLQKRFDLMENLFVVMERTLDHESEVYIGIAKSRTGFNELRQAYDMHKAGDAHSIMQADQGLSTMFRGMRMTHEQYPELQSIKVVTETMQQNVTVENELNSSRRQYNSNVTSYRNAIQSFPNNILAGMFGFKDVYELYKADEEAKSRPKPAAAGYHDAKYAKKIEDLENKKEE